MGGARLLAGSFGFAGADAVKKSAVDEFISVVIKVIRFGPFYNTCIFISISKTFLVDVTFVRSGH